MTTQNFQLIHWDGTKQKRVESQSMELKLGKLSIGSLAELKEVSGKLDVGGIIITNVGAPADASDLTSKSYVDSTAATVASAAVAPTQADLDTLEASFAQELIDRASGDASTLSSAQAYADQKVADLVNSAPAVLDTLKELSDALGGDANFATTIANSIAAVQSEVDAEETRAIAADSAHDSRLDAIEENLETQITTVFENTAAVYADGFPGTQDASFREGWYFKNLVKGNKINWYFFDGTTEAATIASFGAYAVVTFDSVVSKPHLAFYTKPTGSGDVGGWYKSRKVFTASGSPVAGVKYLMYFGTEPEVHPELPRLTMIAAENSVGPLATSEEIMTAVFGSDSNSSANNVQFVCEAIGVNDSNIKRKLQLKIRKASEAALQAEISRAQAAEAALQSSVSTNASTIAAETTRATNAEASLTASLNALSSTVSSLSSGSAADIAAEEARALAAEAVLSGRLDVIEGSGAGSVVKAQLDAQAYADAAVLVEKTRAEGVEAGLQSDIDAVESDLAQEVLDRASAVSAEQDRAEAAELALQGDVDAVAADLAQELLDRAAADTALQGEIDAVEGDLAQELLDRAAADTALQGEVDAVESALAQELLDRAAADTALDGRLDVLEGSGAGSVAKAQADAEDFADAAVLVEKTRAEAAELALQGEVDAVEGDLAQEILDRAAAVSAVQGEVDALEVVVADLNFVTKTADEAIAAGKICYIKSNGNIALADADLDMSDAALVIAAASIASGASGKAVIKEGTVVGGFSGLVPGKKCFVSKTAGEVVQALTGFESGNSVYCVGRAISATEIAFQPVFEFEY
jgi:hypothetical protein